MLYEIKPPFFQSTYSAVGCFVEYQNKILLLQRRNHKPQGNTWEVPAGKVKSQETLMEAMLRKMREETQLRFDASQIDYCSQMYVQYNDIYITFHLFSTQLPEEKTIVLNGSEYKDARWITPQYALQLPLIADLDSCIRLYYKL